MFEPVGQGRKHALRIPPCNKKSTPSSRPSSAEHSPGLAVLVLKDGKKLFERGYGLRDLQSAAKIDAHTNFRLASCSKQFTAMAIMLLVHDGKLRYDQTLTEIFPEFPRLRKIHHHPQSP